MKIRDQDTIAAIATPSGEGAIAVIRVSGKEAVGVVDRVFAGKVKLCEVSANTVHFGRIVARGGDAVDEVLATVFRAPNSYTGEDAVEISCHGGVYVANRVLELVLGAGARQADPGEFTLRSFLNGKRDLSRAEAVADLIHARSEKAHWASMNQLQGMLSSRVIELKAELLRHCSLLEIELDFSEEGIAVIERVDVLSGLKKIRADVNEIIISYGVGRHYRDGVMVVLVGKVNSGKSSIFNALLRENRAIVSPHPGTTRDYIEEGLNLEGVLFRIVDTAGIRDTVEPVEADGVERSKGLLARADVLVLVVDSTSEADLQAARMSIEEVGLRGRTVIAFNKIDLVPELSPRVDDHLSDECMTSSVYLSAKTGAGVELLSKALVKAAGLESGEGDLGFKVTNRRHLNAFQRVAVSLAQAIQSLESGLTNEFVALDVRRAMDALAEVTGEITTDDILNEIFSNFCIGK
jgi:tRNA modification GTPase